MMFVAKPAHKAAARSNDFMFVMIEASQRKDTTLPSLAGGAPAVNRILTGSKWLSF